METADFIKLGTEILTLVGVLGTFGRWVLIKALEERFATKHDVEKLASHMGAIDTKLDTLVAQTWQGSSSRWPRT